MLESSAHNNRQPTNMQPKRSPPKKTTPSNIPLGELRRTPTSALALSSDKNDRNKEYAPLITPLQTPSNQILPPDEQASHKLTHILIVSQDDQIRHTLPLIFPLEAYRFQQVTTFTDATQALTDSTKPYQPSLILIDTELGYDGLLDFVSRVRTADPQVGILALGSGQTPTPQWIAMLDAGVDKVVERPIPSNYLRALIQTIMRRITPQIHRIYTFGKPTLILDAENRHLKRGKYTYHLTKRENALLELFMQHPNQVLTRDTICKMVWQCDCEERSNMVTVHVYYLRQKTEVDGMPRVIHTMRGVGYILREV